MKKALTAAIVAALVTGCAGLSRSALVEPVPAPSATLSAAAAIPPALAKGEGKYLGVYEPENSSSYRQVSSFGQVVGRQPNIALYFSSWGEPFQLAFASAAREHGALPMIQIDPTTVSLADIAAGKDGAYLRSYADAVRAYDSPVIIGFAHEPDGTWYPWGDNRVSPATWVAAWRDVVAVFRGQLARNVVWLWTMNVSSTSPYPLHNWWPGQRYVTWIGIDGYYGEPGDTFASLFGNSINQVRRFTRDPILISETAVGPATGDLSGDIGDLFHGIHRDHLLGPVWFDVGGPQYRQDWRLEDHPGAVAAFRDAVRKFDSARRVHTARSSRGPTRAVAMWRVIKF